ncbi:MAG: adenine nucleotide alpha hydrolase [Armatimonadetes bacterium]|nr:adenine nucleotide alpha hydrolase [Armatimonadota bacterium]MDE2207432.1 adenine nucleotide alpha hydrolase [Armatimonadota bacterium]
MRRQSAPQDTHRASEATPRNRVLLSWSSGKDSAWALHVLRQSPHLEVVGLLTTMNARFDRVAMHGVRRELVEAQAHAANLPMLTAPLPWPCSNSEYEAVMERALDLAQSHWRFTHVAFGDLFLEDVRRYREEKLAERTAYVPVFPLWGINTTQLAHEMIDGGLRAHITCVDPGQIPRDFAGRQFDADLLNALPAEADPCGERGEFHTFAWDGPMFVHPIAVLHGETVERDGFVFTDLLANPSG